MGQEFPSRQIVVTFTHPTPGDALFLPLVESAMQDISEIGVCNLPATMDGQTAVSYYESPNGVLVTMRSAERTFPAHQKATP